MIADLRFVERLVPTPQFGPNVAKNVRILQARYYVDPDEFPRRITEWQDVRLEEEN